MNKAFHISLGFSKGISGGDVCTIEVVRYLTTRQVCNVVVCTESTREMYESVGLLSGPFLDYVTIPNLSNGTKEISVLWAYIRGTIMALKLTSTLSVGANDALFCCGCFFLNSLPFARLARLHPKANVFYWLHMLEPKLWYGFEGTYTGRWTFPDLKRIHYILEMRLYRFLIKPRGVIIACNTMYRDFLKRKLPENDIYFIHRFSGARIPESLMKKAVDKKYDFAWMGRFHEQQGLFELIDVIYRVKKVNPEVNVVVMGGGGVKMEERFQQVVREKGLVENIDWRGVVIGSEKYRLLQQSKIFLMTSYFEGFGIVNLEAMTCGLPVIAYDLPVFDVFEKGVTRVPVLDNASMANMALKWLGDEACYRKRHLEALDCANQFSWEKTGDEIYELLLQSGFIFCDV